MTADHELKEIAFMANKRKYPGVQKFTVPAPAEGAVVEADKLRELDGDVLVLNPSCHPGSLVTATYYRAAHTLRLTCADCGKEALAIDLGSEESTFKRLAALEDIVERQCHSDEEYQQVMKDVPKGPFNDRWIALVAVAEKLMPRRAAISNRLGGELLAAARDAAGWVSPYTKPLAEVLERIDAYQKRAEVLEARAETRAAAQPDAEQPT